MKGAGLTYDTAPIYCRSIMQDGHQEPSDPLIVRRRRVSPWVWPLIVVALAAGAYLLWSKAGDVNAKTPGIAKEGKKGKNASSGEAPAPVLAVRAIKGSIGVYVSGLGTVTPLATVLVRSRVDGELMDVRYREGDTVHKGDVLMQIDPRPYQAALDQAQGQLLKDQATLDNARIDLKRYETLLTQKAIPEQQYATQVATVVQDEGAVKSDQAQIDTAKLNLIYARITAPVTGRLGLRLVDPGNIVLSTDTTGLVVITQMEPISVIFTISEDQLPPVLTKLQAGQALPVEAWSRDMKTKLSQGTLATTDNEIDPTTGTIRLRANFENHDQKLFPNQFVNARLLLQERHGAVLLPSAAIQRTTSSTFVYVINPDSTVSIRNITEGVTEGDETEITSGLTAGSEVVLTGADKLQEGSKVSAQIQNQQPNFTPQSNGGGSSSTGQPGNGARATGATPGNSGPQKSADQNPRPAGNPGAGNSPTQ